MKHALFTFLSFLLITNSSICQQTSVDLLLHTKEENSEFQLDEMVQQVLDAKSDGCITFNVITERDQGSSPYIIEMWESGELLKQYSFKHNRTRNVEGTDGKTVKKRYTAAGINVRSIYKILGRMTERETHSIIDLFILSGNFDKEIEIEEVAKKWKNNKAEQREINALFLEKYASDIMEKRKETQNDVKELIGNQLTQMVANSVLPPTMVSGIAKQKKDKVKKIKIDKCPEIDISQYGTFYYAIYTQEMKGGVKVYEQVGTCYLDEDTSVLGVRKGEKELLPLIESNTPLYIGKHKSMDPHPTSSEKTESTKDISFVFMYQPTHTFTEFERLNLEFIYQASFLGLKNVRVIADDKLTKSINETTSQSIYTYDPDKKEELNIEAGDIMSNTTIFVGVTNPKKLELTSSFLKGDDYDPDASYVITQVEYKDRDGGKKYSEMKQHETYTNKTGLHYTSLQVSLPEIKETIIDERIEMIGIKEEKKGKIKKVYVRSNVPLDKGDTYKLYTNKNITKKSKEIAKLKIDELVNKYVAIAEVKKGDKDIGPYADGKKQVYTKKSEGGGLLGKALRIGQSDGYAGRISYIYGRDEKI